MNLYQDNFHSEKNQGKLTVLYDEILKKPDLLKIFEYLFVFWRYRQLLDQRFLEDLATLINNRRIGRTIDFTIISKGILNVF